MTTMNISLSDSLKQFVDERVAKAGYSSSSEYVRDLIRRDQMQEAEHELAALLRAGIESGPGQPIDARYWKAKRARLKVTVGRKSGRG